MSPYLHPRPQLVEPLLGDLDVPLGHVARLLGVEGVGDAPEDEHVELDPLLPVLFLLLLFFLNRS